MKTPHTLLADALALLAARAPASAMRSAILLFVVSLTFMVRVHADPPLPVIPATNFNIASFGAVGDGVSNNTAAIQNTINAAAAAGGGTVEIPAGTYLSGPLTLASKINLQIDTGATLKMLPFATYTNYPANGGQTYGNLLFANGMTNVEISGSGTIDGNGAAWWTAFDLNSSLDRPYMVHFNGGCERVWIHGITLQNPPKMHIVFKGVDNDITIEGITINTSIDIAKNTDGIDLVGTHCLVRNCTINSRDDNIAIGSSGTSAVATDILITNCTFGAGHGVSIGSNTRGGVSNLTVTSCSFNGTDYGIRMKSDNNSSSPGAGGVAQNLTYSDITMTNIVYGAIVIYSYYNEYGIPVNISPYGASTQTVGSVLFPIWRNITISNVSAVVTGQIAGIIWGRKEVPVTNVVLNHVNISAPSTFDIYNAQGIQFIDSQITVPGSTNTLNLYNAEVTVTNSAVNTNVVKLGGLAMPGTNIVPAFFNARAAVTDTNMFGAGSITLGGSTLTFSQGSVSFSNNVSIVEASTLAFTSGSNTFNGALNGPGSLTFNLSGSSVLTLRNASPAYGGNMTVSNGTLLVNNTAGSATGSGTVTVLSAATLGGNGAVGGPVTVDGTLAPGTGLGTLTINNSLLVNGGAVLRYALGASSDLTAVSGNLTLGGTLGITDAGGFTTGTYTLLTYGGALTYNGLTISTAPSGYAYTIDTSTSGQVKLNVSPWKAQAATSIVFTSVPAYGSLNDLRGKVYGVDPANYRVVVLINKGQQDDSSLSSWSSEPGCASGQTILTTIQSNGTWTADVTNVSGDENATQIAAYVVPATSSPPCVTSSTCLPGSILQQSVANTIATRSAPTMRSFHWSGLDWWVKSVYWGPGPNYFTNSTDNVFVDGQDRLHLRITYVNGHWYCSEIVSHRTLGLGSYSFYLDTPVDALDPNITLGLFTWSNAADFTHREIDVEGGRWGNSGDTNNAHFVVQPYNLSNHLVRYRVPPSATNSMHSFNWQSNSVAFAAVTGTTTVASWTYTSGFGTVPPSCDENVRLNLWLFNTSGPMNGQEAEVIVNKFVFVGPDTDADGMPDSWELAHGLNPNDPADAEGDDDGDGFTNLQEYLAGTDPADPSSHPNYPDDLVVTPAARLISSGPIGGPFSPISQTYMLANVGSNSLNWTASKDGTWLNLLGSGGSLAAGASNAVIVSINSTAATLPKGIYTDTVVFSNATSGVSQTRAMSLRIDQSAAQAGVNSWVSPTRGYWDDYSKWSLGVAPSNTQSVYITNDVSKTVTIDSYTSLFYPDTMTISNLSLSAPAGATNTLDLSSAGTNLPLTVVDTLQIFAGGRLRLEESVLWVKGVITNAVTNAVPAVTNSAFSADGMVELSANGVLVADSGIYIGSDANATGVVWLTGGQLLLTNLQPSAVGVSGSGQLIVSDGLFQAPAGFTLVGAGAGSQGAVMVAGGNYVSSSYGRLAVGMETGAVGVVTVSGGNLVMTNSFLTLVGGDGSGQLNLLSGTNILGPVEVGGDPGSQGTLTVAGGNNVLQHALFVGASIGATGTVWMTGGQLIATSFSTCIAPWGYGVVTVSNGSWLGNTVLLGLHAVTPNTNVAEVLSQGVLNVDGGSVTLLSRLVIGNCSSGGVGIVTVSGGSLFVTNAAQTAFLDVQNGQLNLNGGTLQVDRFVMTNACAQFVRTGGTLMYGSAVLDPTRDDDGDGMPNDWEQAHGRDPLNAVDANADMDGDGQRDLAEFQAGTDPANSASVFRIIELWPEDADMFITWTAVGGKRYALQTATGDGGSFTNDFIELNPAIVAPGTGETTVSVLHLGAATNAPARFYRIRLVTP